jgi:hypothetical protein
VLVRQLSLYSHTNTTTILAGSHFGEGALVVEGGTRGCTVAVAKNAENKRVFALGMDRQLHQEMKAKYPDYDAYYSKFFGAELKKRMVTTQNRDDNRRKAEDKKTTRGASKTKSQQLSPKSQVRVVMARHATNDVCLWSVAVTDGCKLTDYMLQTIQKTKQILSILYVANEKKTKQILSILKESFFWQTARGVELTE